MQLFWNGCYSADLDGTGDGMGALQRQADGTLRYLGAVVSVPSPSFLVQHPLRDDVIYALLEGSARIAALRRTGELAFETLGDQPAAGALPCHASVASNGATLFTASYGNGTLASSPLDLDGKIGSLGTVLDFSGNGPHPDQAHARGHSAVVIDAKILVNLDLGSDEARVFRIGPGNTLQHVQSLRFPPGSGPRDLVIHRSGYLMVLTELSNEIFVLSLSRSGSDLSIISSVSLADDGSIAGSQAAGISPSMDGRHVYAGTRGADVVVTFEVRDGGRSLERVAAVSTGGKTPRHHLIDGQHLYVCNQDSSTVTSFKVNRRSGVPEPLGAPEFVPSPAYLLRAMN